MDSKKHSISLLEDLSKPFIYCLYDDDEVVYVGQSKYGMGRLLQHLKEKKKVFTHFTIKFCPEIRLNRLEAETIAEYLPKYNAILPKNNSKWISYKHLKEKHPSLNWWEFKRLVTKNQINSAHFGTEVVFDKKHILEVLKNV